MRPGKTLRAAAKTVIRALLHPLRRPIAWACQHGFISSQVRKFLPWRWVLEPFAIYGNGWKFQWFPTEFDAIAHRVFWSGLRDWDKETVPVILDNIRRSRYFIDVGANCGIYTVLGATVNPKLRVVAIEPVPRVCAALSRNVKRNNLDSRVTILNVAAGDINGIVSFHEAADATMGSLAVDGYHGQSGRVIQVQCRTLDSIIEELRIEPDFMKIDVEGFEDVVLRGAGQLLCKFRPRIVLEANPGDPCQHMTEILYKHGYALHHITDNGLESRQEIIPVDAYRNWLCLPLPRPEREVGGDCS